jgi:hypothetical protein
LKCSAAVYSVAWKRTGSDNADGNHMRLGFREIILGPITRRSLATIVSSIFCSYLQTTRILIDHERAAFWKKGDTHKMILVYRLPCWHKAVLDMSGKGRVFSCQVLGAWVLDSFYRFSALFNLTSRQLRILHTYPMRWLHVSVSRS